MLGNCVGEEGSRDEWLLSSSMREVHAEGREDSRQEVDD